MLYSVYSGTGRHNTLNKIENYDAKNSFSILPWCNWFGNDLWMFSFHQVQDFFQVPAGVAAGLVDLPHKYLSDF